MEVSKDWLQLTSGFLGYGLRVTGWGARFWVYKFFLLLFFLLVLFRYCCGRGVGLGIGKLGIGEMRNL